MARNYIRTSSTLFKFVLCLAKIFLTLAQGRHDFFGTIPPNSIYSTVRGLGYEYPRFSFPDKSITLSPKWLIVGGRNVIPGSVYRLTVQSLSRVVSEGLPLIFRAAITHDERQVAFGKVLVQPGELSSILMQIPDMSIEGKWQLRVEGSEGPSRIPVFKNTTDLVFSARFLTILIQTSRPVYNAGQTVRFRAVLLTLELKPYEGPVDAYVLDTEGLVMRRWPSRQTGEGVVDLSFKLPEYPVLGNWTLQIRTRQQVQNKTILVEQYFRPRFEVFVRLPLTFVSTDYFVDGEVLANMTNWRDVHGNCSIKLQIATNDEFPIPTQYETLYSEFISDFVGSYQFQFPMDKIATRAKDSDSTVIRVIASVGDFFGLQIQEGFALARIVKERARVAFLGDQPLIFRPGMPINVHVFVSYDDGHPMEAEKLEFSELILTFKATTSETVTVLGLELAENDGVAAHSFNVPNDAKSLEVTARFVNDDGLSAAASLMGVLHHSPRNHHLQIETSTSDAVLGQYIVLHVRSNFFTPYINYVVVANGLVAYSGKEAVKDVSFPTVTTFSLPASAEMSPVAKILVWVVDTNNEVIAHSIAIPVSPFGRHEVDVGWNNHKDHSGDTVELAMDGELAAYFATSAAWEEVHKMGAGHDLDEARILHHMMGFQGSIPNIPNEEIIPNIRIASTRSRVGDGSQVRFFPTSMAGPDAPSTFNFTDIFLLTDAMVYYHPSKGTEAPPCDIEHLPCLTGGCYLKEERCNGVTNCADFSDEAGCPVNIDPLLQHRLHRISRLHQFYDPEYGDWAWQGLREGGGEVYTYDIPKRPQTWIFSMFAVGTKFGLGILKDNIRYDATRPFLLNVDAPRVARMWEQVSLTVGLFNYHETTIGVLVTLEDSPDYQSILVEEKGVVESYNPRRLNRTFQHIVWLPSGASTDVNIPIIFTRLGEVEITIKGMTQIKSDSETVLIEVVPEGASIGEHTSILLDLKDRALAFEFIDLFLDESPIIPYSLKRRYVFGTPEGHVSVTGDVVGPAFPEIPVNEDLMIGLGVMGAETSAYNFGANLWTLHYLRLTNQITDDIVYKVLPEVNVFYAELCRYQSKSGGFSNWINSELSVWLTAHVLRTLWVANFQDWENHIFIDHEIYRRGVSFLLQYQTEEGSFMETDEYIHPLDPKVDPRSRHEWMPKYQNISLTAHVVMALDDVMAILEGDLHKKAYIAQQNAVKYLEHLLTSLTDPYDLAVVTWALMKSDSIESDYAFNALDKLKRIAGDRVYWSRGEIEFNDIIYEDNQRPFIQPKPDNEWDAHSVETTSYALLIYIKKDGIEILQENIVKFLSCMRKSDGGLISTVDSLVATEALVTYSFRARLRDITEMEVTIEQSSDPNATINVFLTSNLGLSKMQEFELDNLFGHLSITGRGAGQALLQLDFSFGVDVVEAVDEPPIPAYEFDLSARFYGRNNSFVSITSCQRWINTDEGDTSGLTVVDIHLPSGYYIMQDELIKMVNSRAVRNLRWAVIRDTRVIFLFNRLDNDEVCFTYTLERWFPVSNHSRYNAAMIYELYQPERFEMKLFEVFPLYALDICEVCGSYQCPYCPFYSASTKCFISLCLPVICTLLLYSYVTLIRNCVN